MKHFMQPKSEILKENNSDSLYNTNPNLSIKKRQPTVCSSAARKQKLLKENSPDLSSIPDPAPSHGGKSSSKMKISLPPRPNSTNSNTLKRKLNTDTVPENSVPVDSDSGVKVVVRMRPHRNDIEGELILQKVSSDCLSITGQAFSFDSVEDINATQLDMFKTVGAPVVEHCLSGFNSSVFAYGQTGSGKTYTMWGPNKALLEDSALSDQKGITPRILERLFSRINEQQIKYSCKQLKYQCRCSFLEIYNEQITDLLDPRQKNLQIREDVKSGVYVENLTEEVVSAMADVTQLLAKGLLNRRTGATSINTESSRSHSVFTCVVESRCKSVEDGMSCLKTSRINLVDLAGSERQKLTGAAGERLKEAGNINKSLSQLGNLINILAEVSQTGKQRHIPYRDSKLTFLLQESLGGNAKLAVICAVSPSERCKNETLSTLRFAQRAKAITNRAVINEVMQDDVNILREVIRQLKDELLRMKASGSTGKGHGNYSTGWNARRSLNLLKFSLSRPTTLPHVDDDSDEEMEIIEDAPENPASDGKNVADFEVGGKNVRPGPTLEQESTITETVTPEEVTGPVSSMDGSVGTEPTCTRSPGFPVDQAVTSDEVCKEMDIVTVPMESPPLLKSPTTSVSPRTDNVPRGAGPETLHLSFARTEKSSSPLKAQPIDTDVGVSPSKRLAASLQCGLQVLERCRRSSRSGRSSFRFPFAEPVAKQVVHVGVQTLPVEDGRISTEDQNPSLCSKCNMVIGSVYDEPSTDALDMQLVPVDHPQPDAEAMPRVPKAVEKVLAGSIRRELALQDICSKQSLEIIQLNHLIKQYKHERENDAVIGQLRDDKILRLESLAGGLLPADQFASEELVSIKKEHKLLEDKYENNPELAVSRIELTRARDEVEKYQSFFELGEREVLMEEIDELRGQLLYYVGPAGSRRTGGSPPPLLAAIPEEEGEAEGLRRDLEAERKCTAELEEAMRLAMEVHGRLLEQYAELEEKHTHLLDRHRRVQDGIFEVKKAAGRAGVRDPDSRFIGALAAELSVLKAEREKERRYLRDENRGLQAQLRDTAEAVQAAGELLVRLKDAEEATAAAEERAGEAEVEMRRAYKKVEKMKRKRVTGQVEEAVPSSAGEDGSVNMSEPWFVGHDRCNI